MNQDPFTAQHLARAEQRRAQLKQLEDQITELAAHIHAATYRLLELIREYDACEGWAGPGLKSCAHWLNWKCGMSLGAARERVRVAHALAELPQISQTLRKGRISYSKVRAITRVATAENEEYLLHIALHGTAQHVERLVRHYRQVKRTEALELENNRHAQRELSWHVDEDGYWVCRGRFTPEQGALIQSSLEAAMEAQFQEGKNVPAGTSLDDPADKLQQRPEPIASHRADALLRVAEAYGAADRQTSTSGDRFLQHVHTDMETLRADGGKTALHNLVLLCRQHHRLVHEGGFGICCAAGGEIVFSNPQGQAIPAAAQTRSSGNVFSLFAAHQQAGIQITAETPIPNWLGERMDDSMAVEGLLQQE